MDLVNDNQLDDSILKKSQDLMRYMLSASPENSIPKK